MGEITLIKIPVDINKTIDGSVKGATRCRDDFKKYTPEEVKKYLQMYISGYTSQEVADHYNVLVHRVRAALANHVPFNHFYSKVSRVNKVRRLSGRKVLEIKAFI
jgi:DNA-binding protein Fis